VRNHFSLSLKASFSLSATRRVDRIPGIECRFEKTNQAGTGNQISSAIGDLRKARDQKIGHQEQDAEPGGESGC
jgi:hypothetical protein